jgi:hypothetical protein
MVRYFCEDHQHPYTHLRDSAPFEFVKVVVTQPVPGNPIVNMIVYWKCPKCGKTMTVIRSWNAEEEKLR